MGTWVFTVLALLNGVFTPVQSGCNARLAKAAGHPLLAAVVNTSVGTLTLLAAVAAVRPGLPRASDLASDLASAPWWAWLGGVLGATYVATNLFLAPKLGAASLVGLVLCGQLLTSVVLDHFGLVGFERRPVDAWRVAGAVLLVAGAALIRRP